MTASLTSPKRMRTALYPSHRRILATVDELGGEATFASLARILAPSAKSETSLRRPLRMLVQHGYLVAVRLTVLGKKGAPYAYVLGRAAIPVLAELRSESPDVVAARVRRAARRSELFFPHRALVTDVRLCLASSCQAHGYGFTWLDEDHFRANKQKVTLTTRSGTTITRCVYPDAFCVLHTPKGDAPLFLEIQRQSKPYQYRKKIELFNAYIDSGLFARSAHYSKVRICAITETIVRAQHLQRLASAMPHAERFWAAALADIRADAAGEKVWFIGGSDERMRLV
jgi:hypothetical protein